MTKATYWHCAAMVSVAILHGHVRAQEAVVDATNPSTEGSSQGTVASADTETEETPGAGETATPDAQASDDEANGSGEESEPATTPPWKIGAYAEIFYQRNFNEPSNGITHFRGFDNRHNSFTIANVALDFQWDYERIVGRVALQVGHTPSTYYLAEPALPGSAASNSSGAELWKYLQQAHVGYRFDIGDGLLLTAGLFLSPIGPEGMVVHDNWNWSRSNLFFGLPFYHTGVRLTYPLTSEWSVTAAAYNGWNSVTDNNEEKSFSAQLTYTDPDVFSLSLLYFSGVERATGSPEGRAWRHLFDVYATWYATPDLSFLAHANGGFEPNTFGLSSWAAGALYVRARLLPELFAVVRGDAFYENAARNSAGTAGAIFWPTEWVSSGTATIDYRPHERVSLRVEYRHDHAAGDMFFGGNVMGDGSAAMPFLANRTTQDTVTLGATTWY